MKVKFILIFLVFFVGVLGVQAAAYPAPFVSGGAGVGGSSIVAEEVKSPDKFENYSSDIQKALNKEPVDWTIREACISIKGCFDFEEKICYPFGYIKGGKYCSDNLIDYVGKRSYGFTAQKGWGNLCERNLECESNLCFDGKCVRTIESELIDPLIQRISVLEEKLNMQNGEEDSKSPTITGGAVSENSDGGSRFFGWIKKFFK